MSIYKAFDFNIKSLHFSKFLLLIFLCPIKASLATPFTVSLASDTYNFVTSPNGVAGELRYAMYQLNSSSTSGTININTGLGTINLNADLPVLQYDAVINGPAAKQVVSGATSGAPTTQAYRLFATYNASLTLNNLTLQYGKARGGNGAKGGGGGLGAGGGSYIDFGKTLTLANTTISNCLVVGGNGSNDTTTGSCDSGAGGGASFSMASQDATNTNGGGDFAGLGTTAGGSSRGGATGYGGGTADGGNNGPAYKGGYGTTNTSAAGGNALVVASTGGLGGYCGGGGAGGTGNGAGSGGGGGNPGGAVSNLAAGAGGGYGSGGGGGVVNAGGGGGGGFGGGGGAGATNTNTAGAGGAGGGWGGGGGGSGATAYQWNSGPKTGGYGGAYGGRGTVPTAAVSYKGSGGGGAAIGGAIFVADSALLNIGDGFSSSGNILTGGSGGTSNGASVAAGGTGLTYANDIFLFQQSSLVFNSTTTGYPSGTPFSAAIQSDIVYTYANGLISNISLGNSNNYDKGITVSVAAGLTVTLSNANNSYLGPTTINSGTLSISSDSNNYVSPIDGVTYKLGNLGSVPNAVTANSITFGGGTLATTATMTLAPNRGITLNAGGGTLAPANTTTLTYNGVITGSGNLSINGNTSGIVALNGTNTNTGGVTLNGGTLQIGADLNLGAAPGAVTPASLTFNGGKLLLNASITVSTNRGITVNANGGTIALGSSTTSTYNGVLNGSGPFTFAGGSSAALNLGGNSTGYTGAVTHSDGYLKPTVNNILPNASSFTMSGPGQFQLNGTNQAINNLSGGASNIIDVGANTLSINQTVNGTYTGALSGSGAVVITGSATFTSALNGGGYTGTWTINSGTLAIGADSYLGNIPASVTAASISFGGGTLATTASFTLSTNRGITLNAGGGIIAPASGTTLTYNGVIAGAAGNPLTIGDAGTLVLNAASSYQGATNINAGMLQTNTPNAISSTSALVLSATTASTFNLNNNSQTVGSLSGGASATIGNISLGSATLTVKQTAAGSYGGVISGTGGLTLSNLSTNVLTLTNTNTYTGINTLNGGTLSIGADLNLGASPAAVSATSISFSGGTLASTNSFTLHPNRGITLTGAGILSPANTTTLTYNGVITGAGNLSINGNTSGIVVLNGTNTNTGGVTLNGGTLSVGADLNLGAEPGAITAASITFNGGTLASSASFTLHTNRGITLTGAGILSPANATTLTYNGVITGAANLSINGNTSGIVILNGTNTNTGGVTLNGGTLSIGTDLNLGAAPGALTPASITFNGGTLATTNNFTLHINRGITLTGAGILAPANATTLTYNGVLTGSGNLSINGNTSGIVVLNGTNTNTGGVTLNGGTLQIGADLNLGAAPGALSPAAITFNGGTLATTNTFTLQINRGITLIGAGILSPANTTTLTYNGVITGNNSLTMNGAGTLILNGANTYIGPTNLNAGFLQISADNNLGTPQAMPIDTSLNFGGGALITTNNFTLNANRRINLNAPGIIQPGAATTLTYNGIISGNNALTMNGLGTLVLGGINTYTGGTNVMSGTLQVIGISIPSTGAVTISGGTYYLTAGVSPSIVVNNQVGGNIQLAGTLTAANTSTNAGVLQIDNGGVFAAPAVFTNTGTTNLNGTGSITGAFNGTGGATLNIGSTSAATYSTVADMTMPNINVNTVGGTGSVFNVNNNLLGTGTLSVQALSTLNFATSTNSMNVTNNGNLNITGNFSNTGTITNNSGINIAAGSTLTLTGTGSITGAGGLNGTGLNSSLVIDNNFTASGPINNIDKITINAARTLSLGVGSSLNNYKVLNINGNLTILGGATFNMSAGDVNVNNNANFTGNFVVSGGNFNVNGTASFNNPLIFNGGTSNINAVNAPSMTLNNGTHTFNNFAVPGNVNINNAASMIVNGDIAANNLINNGSLQVNTAATLTGNYTLNGTHITDFNGTADIATLTVNGVADITNGTVIINITNEFIANTHKEYDVIIGEAGYIPPLSIGNLQVNNHTSTVEVDFISNNYKLSLTAKNKFALSIKDALNTPNASNILETFKDIFASNDTPLAMKTAAQSILIDLDQQINDNDVAAATKTMLKIAPNFSLPLVREIPTSTMTRMLAVKVASLRNSYQAGEMFDGSIWLKPVVAHAHKNTTNDTLGYNSLTTGLIGGTDFHIQPWLSVGMALGVASTKANVSFSSGSQDDSISYLFMPYFSVNENNHALDVIYSYTKTNVNTNRIVNYGTLLTKSKAQYTAYDHMLNIIYGYNLKINDEYNLKPTMSFQYSSMQKNSYTESGDLATLNVVIKRPKHAYELGMGFNFVHKLEQLNEYNCRTEISLMGLWSPGNRKIISTGQFTIGGRAFDYITLMPRTAFRAGVTLAYNPVIDIDLKASYFYKVAKKYSEHSASIELKYFF